MTAVLSGIDLAAVAIFGVVILVALTGSRRRLSVKVGQISAAVDDVNRAVNNRSEGEPTIYQKVDGIERKLDEHLAYHRGAAESSRGGTHE